MKTLFASKLIISLLLLLVITGTKAQTAPKALAIGDRMPAFSLTDQNGKTFNSANYVGKSILVVYFYPKDESMVCTKEACSFRDSFDAFTKAGAKVIGINAATVASHKSFSNNHNLQFTLLSDPDNKVYHLFGIKNNLFTTGRETFIINLKGNIIYTHQAMLQGKGHADAALQFIKAAKTN